jgi:hypothetical protein
VQLLTLPCSVHVCRVRSPLGQGVLLVARFAGEDVEKVGLGDGHRVDAPLSIQHRAGRLEEE